MVAVNYYKYLEFIIRGLFLVKQRAPRVMFDFENEKYMKNITEALVEGLDLEKVEMKSKGRALVEELVYHRQYAENTWYRCAYCKNRALFNCGNVCLVHKDFSIHHCLDFEKTLHFSERLRRYKYTRCVTCKAFRHKKCLRGMNMVAETCEAYVPEGSDGPREREEKNGRDVG